MNLAPVNLARQCRYLDELYQSISIEYVQLGA